jgi:CheY-like chemotaxis protein
MHIDLYTVLVRSNHIRQHLLFNIETTDQNYNISRQAINDVTDLTSVYTVGRSVNLELYPWVIGSTSGKKAWTVEKIRILIVDDISLVRKGLSMCLEAEPDLIVVGEAADGQAALDQVAALRPDVVLVDVEMPGMDGILTTRALHSLYPQASVILLSMHDDRMTCQRAEEAEVAAFIVKTMPADILLTAIHRAAQRNIKPKAGDEGG